MAALHFLSFSRKHHIIVCSSFHFSAPNEFIMRQITVIMWGGDKQWAWVMRVITSMMCDEREREPGKGQLGWEFVLVSMCEILRPFLMLAFSVSVVIEHNETVE